MLNFTQVHILGEYVEKRDLPSVLHLNIYRSRVHSGRTCSFASERNRTRVVRDAASSSQVRRPLLRARGAGSTRLARFQDASFPRTMIGRREVIRASKIRPVKKRRARARARARVALELYLPSFASLERRFVPRAGEETRSPSS